MLLKTAIVGTEGEAALAGPKPKRNRNGYGAFWPKDLPHQAETQQEP